MHVRISKLSVHYEAQSAPAVDHVTIALADGEIGVLIGPSGCGKTSLLRAVAGLISVSDGEVSLGDKLVSARGYSVPPEQRRIGMVFQDYALFPHLNVARNVAFGLHGLPKKIQAARLAEVLALVGLPEAAQRFPHELSGGQQQRVALARALAPRPKLMLLDEPFSNLDVELRERLAHEMRGILKTAGATALFVTHDQLEAFAIGDKIGVMNHGALEQWDDPYALYHRPATRFVASFIGHGVFVPAQLKQHSNGVAAETPLGTLEGVNDCPLSGQYPDGVCDVLLRADDIVHDDAAPTKARVVRKAFRGSEFLYTLEMQGGQQLVAHVPSHHDHAVGEWIGVRVEADHLVTFAPVRRSVAADGLPQQCMAP